ncbi:hypothetical protein SDC9_142848 [bioreactor metagenome]|jgi:hypothetical protein|uniref:Uncharacterized protein n=1 Tax=bioreactor metagenome TaxID=1076179 RepID=A0A645E4H7_9ZZZZ
MPLIRASIASSLAVASISTTREDVPAIPNCTVKPGNVREGFNLTGSRGISANPSNATQINATIIVKDETVLLLLVINTSLIKH